MTFLIAIIVLLVIWGGWFLFNRYRLNQVADVIDSDQLNQMKRRAQIIDLREKRDFNAGHILGARSIAYSTFRQFYSEIRPDLPVVLYDQGQTISTRAAVFLHKHGYTKIAVLKAGFKSWTGKTKKSEL